MFNITKKTRQIAGKELTIETGRMAKQANGSVFVTYGGTSVLVTATASKEAREGTDFFPLTVDYIEKMYAAGKIPGGFFKREARPTTNATLSARLLDRAIRPMFPDGFRNAVHVVLTVLSYDGINNPNNLGILGASTALSISDIPFLTPVAGVSVGLVNDELIINPTTEQLKESDLELEVAGSDTSIVMIEAGAIEVNEDKIMDAIYTGHETIKELVELQNELAKEVGKEKMEVTLDVIPEELAAKIEKEFGNTIKEASALHGKLERYEAFDNAKKAMLEKYEEVDGEEFAANVKTYKNGFEALVKKYVRSAILDNHRVDGRGLDDIRPIMCEIDVLSQVHGSALFTRGETQSLGVITLGTDRDQQIIDGLGEEYKKPYYLHYNFPPFSVGEAGFMRGPGRRELGHGALAERALAPVLPNKEDFPYTIRIVSEILESNGSSSMATVCSGTLALMAGGVPITKPVAGIANGLIMEGDKYVVLTDIMGLEDHLGDMDFKVTGTEDGITAMQMDIKIDGINKDIMKIALDKAKVARLYILGKITDAIEKPREDLADTAPQIETIQVKQDQIGTVIGQGGKMIKSIIERFTVDVNIDDEGNVSISSTSKANITEAIKFVKDLCSEPEMNKIYEGEVVRIENYGAFVKFMNGTKDGLVHISQIHSTRINKTEDVVNLGDNVKVKFIGAERGKYSCSMKGIEGNPNPKEGAAKYDPSANENQRRDSRPNDRNRNSRDGRKRY
jgi:polyribonucleotide nucleotidyltransferase